MPTHTRLGPATRAANPAALPSGVFMATTTAGSGGAALGNGCGDNDGGRRIWHHHPWEGRIRALGSSCGNDNGGWRGWWIQPAGSGSGAVLRRVGSATLGSGCSDDYDKLRIQWRHPWEGRIRRPGSCCGDDDGGQRQRWRAARAADPAVPPLGAVAATVTTGGDPAAPPLGVASAMMPVAVNSGDLMFRSAASLGFGVLVV